MACGLDFAEEDRTEYSSWSLWVLLCAWY